MFESNFNKYLLLPLLGLALASMLMLLPFNNLQFIIFAAFPFLMLTGAVLTKRKLLLDIKSVDLFWVGFTLLGFLSYLWATNPALVWYRGFSFLGLFLISLIFRDLIKYPLIRRFFPFLLSVLFLVIFLQHLLAVHFLKILSAILILNILFLANVKIVILSLLMIMLYYFWSNQRKLLFILFTMAVFGIIIINGFFSYDELMAKHFADIYKPDNFSRLDLANLSIDLIRENPLVGVGKGNWITEVYNQDLREIGYYNQLDDYSRLHSHNLFLKIAGELGVIGLFLFLSPFVITLYHGFKKVSELDYVEKASFASVLSYLCVSTYYGGVNLYEYNFSGVEVLAFASMGILSNKLLNTRKSINYFVTLPLTILTIIWFLFSAISWHSIHTVLHHNNDVSINSKIEKLTDVYSSTFLTTYGFDRLLDLDIAELYASNNDSNKAIFHYERMMALAPYNCTGLVSYSQFLIDNNLDLNKAKEILLKVKSIQPSPEVDQLLSQLNSK